MFRRMAHLHIIGAHDIVEVVLIFPRRVCSPLPHTLLSTLPIQTTADLNFAIDASLVATTCAASSSRIIGKTKLLHHGLDALLRNKAAAITCDVVVCARESLDCVSWNEFSEMGKLERMQTREICTQAPST